MVIKLILVVQSSKTSDSSRALDTTEGTPVAAVKAALARHRVTMALLSLYSLPPPSTSTTTTLLSWVYSWSRRRLRKQPRDEPCLSLLKPCLLWLYCIFDLFNALAYLLLEAIKAFYKMWEIIMWVSRRILIIDRRIQHQFLAIFSKIFVQTRLKSLPVWKREYEASRKLACE